MRTAIFVREPSTVTIRASDPLDAKIEICRYPDTTVPAVGTHQLQPGIYLIVSNRPLEVVASHADIETMGTDKDEWPDPKPNVVALEPGATAAEISRFLTVAKGF